MVPDLTDRRTLWCGVMVHFLCGCSNIFSRVAMQSVAFFPFVLAFLFGRWIYQLHIPLYTHGGIRQEDAPGWVDGWTPAVVSILFCCIHACTYFQVFCDRRCATYPLGWLRDRGGPGTRHLFLYCLSRPACFYSRCIHTRFLSHNSLVLYLFCYV